jgi:PPM family protein phosphatase
VANQPRLAVESIAGQRPYQEDSVLAETLPDGRTLLAVADGMGGHAAGEVASQLALETLVEAVREGRSLSEGFRLANERVHRMAMDPGKQGMGTTLVAVLVEGTSYWVANVVDSRAYLVSARDIRRLTEDHSFVAEAMKRGQSEAEAMSTPWRDALTRSIGTELEVEADVTGPHSLEPDAAFVICSDGLYKALSDDEIREHFVRTGGVEGAAETLVSAALNEGSDDNISVAIAEYGEVPREPTPATMILSFDSDATREEERRAREARAAMSVDESAVIGALPVAAVAAAVVVVGVLLAILLLGS